MVTDVSVGFRLPCWSSDLNLGEGLCICTSFHFLDSGLYLSHGFDFDLFWMARHWKPAIIIILLLFSAAHDHSNYNALTVKVLKKNCQVLSPQTAAKPGYTFFHSAPLQAFKRDALNSVKEVRRQFILHETGFPC